MDRNEVAAQHILVMPCMVQSHIIPLLQFSKSLASKGHIVTLIFTSSSTTNRFSINLPGTSTNTISVRIEYIFDGTEECSENLQVEANTALNCKDKDCFRPALSKGLSQLIKKLLQSNCPPKVLVYDVGMPWALDIALDHGLHGAVFFTICCSVNAVFCLVHQSGQQIPVSGQVDSIPSFPVLEQNDLPSLLTRDSNLYPKLMKLVMNHFSSTQKAKFHLVNSFMELEEEAVKWIRLQIGCPLLTVGPTVLPMYLDHKKIEGGDKDYALSLSKLDMETCTTWLDSKEAGSVVYVSFGSLASLGHEQMKEVAWGLRNSHKYFLWVMKDSDKTKLPVGFLEVEKGLVVNLCSQLQVLDHKAIGCFVTHCGWNSTLEALSLGVPMVAMPQWADQLTTAKFVTDVWKVGIRVPVDVNGIGKREEIARCVKEVIEGEKGKEMKIEALRWRELAQKAVGKGGSSDDNIEEFIASLSCA